MVAPPAAVDEPHPKIRTQDNRESKQKPITRRFVFDSVPAGFKIRRVVSTENAGITRLGAAHVGGPRRCVEKGPGIPLARFAERRMGGLANPSSLGRNP